MKSKLIFIVTLAVLYLLSAGISYGIFSFTNKSDSTVTKPDSTVNPGKGLTIDQSAPKTEVCPLNGKLYTKQEKAVWETRRPLAVMIENTTDARPQSGLSKGDIVYEAVAEGGITRFMSVNYCAVAENTEFAPVRSARTYYVDLVSEYDALYNHVGGAGICSDVTVDTRAKALCQIIQYKIKDLDQFGISFPTCFRNPDRLDRPVATEHQMVCQSEGLYKIAQTRNWTNVDETGKEWSKSFTPWKFTEEAKTSDRGTTASISYSFWDRYQDFNVSWEYDSVNNEYKRVNGGQPHLDHETNSQLTAKNVIVQLVKETGPVDEHKHMLYEVIGSGEALIFQNGKTIKGKWTKKTRVSRTIFTDEKGKEVAFNPGVIWISLVPKGNEVTY